MTPSGAIGQPWHRFQRALQRLQPVRGSRRRVQRPAASPAQKHRWLFLTTFHRDQPSMPSQYSQSCSQARIGARPTPRIQAAPSINRISTLMQIFQRAPGWLHFSPPVPPGSLGERAPDPTAPSVPVDFVQYAPLGQGAPRCRPAQADPSSRITKGRVGHRPHVPGASPSRPDRASAQALLTLEGRAAPDSDPGLAAPYDSYRSAGRNPTAEANEAPG